MSGTHVKRVQVGMVVMVALLSVVPGALAVQASTQLAQLEASPLCADEQAAPSECRREEPVRIVGASRFDLTVRDANGHDTVVRLAPSDNLGAALIGRPDDARATYFGGVIVTLDWGAGSIETEAHPAARQSWYGSVCGALWLLLLVSLVAGAWAARRARHPSSR